MKIKSVIIHDDRFKEFNIQIRMQTSQDLEDLNYLLGIAQSANPPGSDICRKRRVDGIIDRFVAVIQEAK